MILPCLNQASKCPLLTGKLCLCYLSIALKYKIDLMIEKALSIMRTLTFLPWPSSSHMMPLEVRTDSEKFESENSLNGLGDDSHELYYPAAESLRAEWRKFHLSPQHRCYISF